MSLQQIPGLHFADSDLHGRGMYCLSDLQSGDLIEVAPMLILPKVQLKEIDKTVLYEYYFMLGEKMDIPIIVFGYGSLYNHSDTPNAEYQLDLESKTVHFVAVKNIPAGNEITINYRDGTPDEPLWFDDVESLVK